MRLNETLNWFYDNCIKGKYVGWHNFTELGMGESYCQYHYAENRLYIIRDSMTDQLYFVKADSLKDAFLRFSKRMKEAQNAGSYVDEDEEV